MGCPAVPKAGLLLIIETIKNGSCFFIYHQNETYAKRSKIINSKFNWPSMPTANVDAAASENGYSKAEEAYAQSVK